MAINYFFRTIFSILTICVSTTLLFAFENDEQNQNPGKVLTSLVSTPPEELQSINDCILQLDHEYKVRGNNSEQVLESVTKLSREQRLRLIENVLPFMAFPDMKEENLHNLSREQQKLVVAVAGMKEENLKGLPDKVTEFRRKVIELSSSNELSLNKEFESISGYARYVRVFGELAPMERDLVFKNALSAIEGTIWHSSSSCVLLSFNSQLAVLIRATNLCLQKELDFQKYLSEMLSGTKNKMTDVRITALHYLSRLLDDDVAIVEPIVQCISQHLPYLLSDDGRPFEIETAIESITTLWASEINFEHLIMPILKLDISKEQKRTLLGALVEVTCPQHRCEGNFVYVAPTNRNDFFACALRLCSLPIAEPNYRSLIDKLAGAQADQWNDRIQSLIDLSKPSYTQTEIEETLGGNLPDRIWLDDNEYSPR